MFYFGFMKWIYFLMAVVCTASVHAQKKMQVPAPLDTLTPQQIKRKSGIGVILYDVSPYKVINAKQRWVGSTRETEGGFLSEFLSTVRDVKDRIKEKKSFKLVSTANDTAVINVAITTVLQFEQYKRGLLGNRYESTRYDGGYVTWIAGIETKDTSQHWLLTVFQEEKVGIVFNKTTPLQATLRNGDEELEVQSVQFYDNGKKAWDILGFVIYEKGVPLAAVQFRGDNPLKNHLQNYFWLSPQLTAERQLLFTAILTSMLDIGQDSNFTSVEQRGDFRN